jgi:hypothetical protein
MTRDERAALEVAVLREALAELRARRRERAQRVREDQLWQVLARRWGYPTPRRSRR